MTPPSSPPPPAARLEFLRQWLKNPLGVAAVSPSSPQLARQMIAALPAGTRRVIEFGGGTGAITEALLASGIPPAQLLVLELNEALHQHLRHRFPDVPVVLGNAMDVRAIGEAQGFFDAGPADAVVSGLGLLAMGRELQLGILRAAFAVLAPTGRFVQFTYGPANPVTKEVIEALELSSRRASFTWWNVPPATVYVIERQRSRAIPTTPMGRR
jgi:phospholipid N-methyltransferase